MSKSVLLAIDGSSGGAHALQHILAFTDSASVKVVLAYVIEWSPYSFNTPEENAERHKRRESEISRAEAGVVNPAQKQTKYAVMTRYRRVRANRLFFYRRRWFFERRHIGRKTRTKARLAG